MPTTDPVSALSRLIDAIKVSVGGNANIDRQVVSIASDADSVGAPLVAGVSASGLRVDASTSPPAPVKGFLGMYPLSMWQGGDIDFRMTAAMGAVFQILSASPGRLWQVRNVGPAQTVTVTCYDNASAANGNIVYTLANLGPGQIVPVMGRYNNGLTIIASAAIGADIVFSLSP